MVECRLGRTGRFGRRGISINFVHDKRTWDEMQVIQHALSKDIIRIGTSDFDKMEKVRPLCQTVCRTAVLTLIALFILGVEIVS